ncbi:MAG TPA: DUF2066 domain-containing protein [Marinagarivorans sp.]
MRQLILGVLFCIAAWPAWASVEYFSAQVPVSSQSANDRKAALSQAMASVLVKVSGSLDAPESEQGRIAQANAGAYVQQYRYVQPTQKQREQGFTLLLKADFDPDKVRALLKDSGQGVWPSNRPQTLIWAIEDTPENGRQIIADPENPRVAALFERAQARGLPILWPLWDLDDQFMLPAESLWALDDEAILAASARYDVNTVLIARYSETTSGEWFATWQFYHAGEQRSYDYRTLNEGELGALGIDPLVAFLAQRYAVQNSTDDSELLQVVALQGVDNYHQYSVALEYLEKQSLIRQVSLVGVRDSELTLHILLSGSWQQLADALALDRKVQLLNPPDNLQAQSVLGAPDYPAQLLWLGR